MSFLYPLWLILVIPWIALLFSKYGKILRSPLRIFLVLLTLLLLANPVLHRSPKGLHVWALFDCSKSIPHEFRKQMNEWSHLISQSKGPADRLTFHPFAKDVYESLEPSWKFEEKDTESNIGLALRTAMDRMNPDAAHRIILFSDGYSTDSLREIERDLIREGIAIDSRTLESRTDLDVRIQNLEIPVTTSLHENYLVRFQITGKPGLQIPYRVMKDGQKVYESTVEMKHETEQVRLSDSSSKPGISFYEVTLDIPNDPILQNNRSTACISVEGSPKVLLLSAFQDDPIADSLRKQGIEVDIKTPDQNNPEAALTSYRAIWMNQFPAYAASPEFWKVIDFQVRYQGAGLVMTGGRKSFAPGGFFSSPIGDLLPVSMELRKDHRKIGTTLVISMDRSGSMGASVGKFTKMDLANDACARSIDLLGDDDLISVFAVDTVAHPVVDLCQIGNHRNKITRTVRRIESQGGGIFIYEALEKAWAVLKKANVGLRHIILFADASDSEEPKNYKSLLEEITSNGATVSVIGMGTEKDQHAELLKDIAKRGKGRIFFSDNPSELPSLFTQETVAVSRSAFIEEPTTVSTSSNWLQIAAKPITPPPQIQGYNLNYLREGASGVFFSMDTYKAPLLSFWNRGAGRVAAIGFPMAGENADAILNWSEYGNCVSTLSRWLMGESLPKGVRLKTTTEGLDLLLDLYYDDTWISKIASQPPRLHWIQQGSSNILEKSWEKMSPGHFFTRVRIEPGKVMRGSVSVGDSALPFGPLLVQSDVEWDFSPKKHFDFKSLIQKTGGIERIDLASIWKSPRPTRQVSFQEWLWLLWILAFLGDAYQTRIMARSDKKI